MDGFSLAKIILKVHPKFPILFLTAKNQKIDRLTGLKIGADDYIAKTLRPGRARTADQEYSETDTTQYQNTDQDRTVSSGYRKTAAFAPV
ncbi:response regulator [Chryseobacterium sp. SORGH_AS_1175]|uniref:response regulator n=1 Tax=Chryseobacterium sp. SORGH_AS_1175 TaxID=3041760 RepID=UPI00286C0977|nr:response regulator [Chryseobacterium sp. SORGH_AS_1175]